MRFGSASASLGKVDPGLGRLLDRAEAEMGARRADLVIVFLSSHFEDEVDRILEHVSNRYPSAVVMGCSAEGVIGGDQEHERTPSLAVMIADLPGVRLTPFRVPADQLARLDPDEPWSDVIGVSADDWPSFLLFGDPFTVPVKPVLSAFDRAYPERPVLGGMASGCEAPGQTVIVVDGQVQRDGFGGVALSGAVHIEPVVSQGCRPIGHPLVITRCERNILHTLGGRPAAERLQDIIDGLPPRDAKLAREALFIGRVINEYKETFTRGDFLIRHLIGYDPRSGAIAVGDEMRIGATVQFHVREAESADEDLRQMLAPHGGRQAPAGVLLFSCNGRGTRMWPERHHDVSTVRQVCGPVPVAGFFAAGEIGPVSGRSFIHGHTASMALFRPAETQDGA